MLHISFSNDTDLLLELLLKEAGATDDVDPFRPTDILVPSGAMRRRIESAMADRFGICANLRFSFLAQWMWGQIARMVNVQEESPFAPEIMCWRIYAALQDSEFTNAHPRLAAWIDRADDVMRFDLATRTAAVFDRYMTYRSDWLQGWLDGKLVPLKDASQELMEDQRWQMALWQRIARELAIRRQHPSVAFLERLAVLDLADMANADIPPVLHVFVLPDIPPLYLDILRRLALRIDVRMYVHNPCQEYWFDIVEARRLSWLAVRQRDAHHEVGNRLLAAWGRQSQAQIEQLLDDSATCPMAEVGAFAGPGSDTLLHALQTAVLELRDLTPGSTARDVNDRSIEVHVCHTFSRELEVLHDQLLDILSGPQPPKLSEILVVTPSLETAAPFIDAVFGSATGARRIPYSISGRPVADANPVAAVLQDLLALASSRFHASAVFALLQNPLVGQRFGLDANDLDTVQAWLANTGIHWGLDSAHCASFDVPGSDLHTWSGGLRRLFLGYALPADARQPFQSQVPQDSPEGDASVVLGCFHHFVASLERLHVDLAQARTPNAWCPLLLGLADSFVAQEEDVIEDANAVRHGIAALCAQMDAGGLRRPTPVNVVRAALQQVLEAAAPPAAPSGAVTFASLSSLRNLPYRIVCIVGMNDGAFPTSAPPVEFDLMRADRRKGDRQRRDEERNVFLDLLLAASDRVLISYTGKSVRDNSPLPPSVLVADLLDYLGAATAQDAASPASVQEARDAMTVQHPLQPFSPSCFTGGASARIFSFNHEYCEALQLRQRHVADSDTRRAAGARHALATSDPNQADDQADDDGPEENELPATAFFREPLPPLEEAWRSVSLEQLRNFFRNPARYLLQQRLHVAMPDELIELRDDEPLLPEWTAHGALAARLLPQMLAGANSDDIAALARSGLEYPPGAIGELLLGGELHSLSNFAVRLREHVAAPLMPPLIATLPFAIEGEQWTLEGALSDLRPQGLVRYRYDDTRVGDYLGAWLAHLFLNAAVQAGTPYAGATASRVLARDGEFLLRPVEQAQKILQELVQLYRHGLAKPLHFFPKSAWAYIEAGDSHSAAKKKFLSSPAGHGEDRDAACRIAFRGVANPLDAEFEAAAKAVFGTMKDHLDEVAP
jgi:exodeoxyribonuclease V gamma subunit